MSRSQNIFSDWIVVEGFAIDVIPCRTPVGSWAAVPAGGLPMFHDSGSSTVTSMPSRSSISDQPPSICCQVPETVSHMQGGSAPL